MSKEQRKSAPKKSKAVVPAGQRTPHVRQTESMIVPKGYTARPVQPAKNYDVVSFARAMNDDFGPRVKKLFDPEREAALLAQQTGVYIGWRLPNYKHDCQRVGPGSKCFCGHLLDMHGKYNCHSVMVPCQQCPCKGFAWVPSRPEEVGEFWFQRRRNFDPSTWRAKCRCKHTHEEHNPNGLRRCKSCGCGAFDSNFLCAACDKHWEEHQTIFETADMRRQNEMPTGTDYLPFAEIPSLRNMVLTGEDDEDMSYMALNDGPYAIPPASKNKAITDGTPFNPFGGAGGGGRGGGGASGGASGFKPVYD